MIVLGILAITVNKAFWVPFFGYWGFWAGPFTPAMPIQFGLAMFLKKIFGKKKKDDNFSDDSVSESADRERLNKDKEN